jgi:uncharacterized protein YuzE
VSDVYVYVHRNVHRVATTREILSGINVDFDEFGLVIGVEILGANGVTVDGTEVGVS